MAITKVVAFFHFSVNLRMNKQVNIWFSAVMIMLVTCGAILFAFTDVMIDTLYGNKRTLLIFVFAAYSIYRAMRLKFLLKRKDEE